MIAAIRELIDTKVKTIIGLVPSESYELSEIRRKALSELNEKLADRNYRLNVKNQEMELQIKSMTLQLEHQTKLANEKSASEIAKSLDAMRVEYDTKLVEAGRVNSALSKTRDILQEELNKASNKEKIIVSNINKLITANRAFMDAIEAEEDARKNRRGPKALANAKHELERSKEVLNDIIVSFQVMADLTDYIPQVANDV